MQIELPIDKVKSVENSSKNNTVDLLKTIANDGIFYFAVFLTLLVILQLLPYFGGIFEGINFGINEVAVSFIGYLNVFFLQFYNKILNKSA